MLSSKALNAYLKQMGTVAAIELHPRTSVKLLQHLNTKAKLQISIECFSFYIATAQIVDV